PMADMLLMTAPRSTDTAQVTRRRWFQRDALAVFVLCLAARSCALAWWPADTGTLYFQLATSFARDHRPIIDGELTTHIEPFYALVLAAFRLVCGGGITAMLICQIAVASLGGVLLFRLALEISDRVPAAWIAAVLYAVSPYL